VIRRHLVPALGPVIAANLVFVAGLAVAIEAGLSFLGLGDPAAVSWGGDLERAISSSVIREGSYWLWWLLPPGVALTFAIFGLSLVGVALEPRFNPRQGRL
jgi:peptide/nickel transport system permease protein